MPTPDDLRKWQREHGVLPIPKMKDAGLVIISVRFEGNEELFTIRNATLQDFERVLDAMEEFKHVLDRERREEDGKGTGPN